jgi:hypothetical protein
VLASFAGRGVIGVDAPGVANGRFILTDSGNIGIGTASPQAKLHLLDTNAVYIQLTDSADGASRVGQNGTAMTFGVDGGNGTTERMRINSSGQVGIGTSSPASRLTVNSGAAGMVSNFTDGVAQGLALVTGTGYFGFYNPNYGVITFRDGSNGAENVRITDSGNVGIGTSSPNVAGVSKAVTVNTTNGSSGAIYEIAVNGTNHAYLFANASNTVLSSVQALPLLFSTTNTERMRITSSGDVGIGISSPVVTTVQPGSITANGVLAVKSYLSSHQNDVGIIEYNTGKMTLRPYGATAGSGYLAFNTGGGGGSGDAERARIDSSGNLLVGTTATASYFDGKLNVAGYSCFKVSGSSITPVQIIWNNADSGDNEFISFFTNSGATFRGGITYNRTAGITAYNTTSDYRAKDILGPVTDVGETIDALKVYSGKMKGATIARPMLVAHEAQEVVPYAVTGEKDAVNEDGTDKYQQMDHQSFIPLLIAEIQSLRARVAQLEGK